MADPKLAVQDAFFDALNVAEVTGLAPLYQYVPENSQPPLIIIGDITSEPAGGKDGGFDRMSVDIITVSREPSRRSLYLMQAAVREALDGKKLSATGIELSRPQQESSEDALLEDGETFQGTQRFTAFAQPA